MIRLYIYALFSLCIFAKGDLLSAQNCSATVSPLAFGVVNLVSGSSYDTTGTVTINCNGSPNKKLRVCTSFNAGSGGTIIGHPRFMTSGLNKINYGLYTTASLSNVWGSFTWGFAGSYPGSRAILIGAPSGGGSSITMTIYGRIMAGQTNIPVGSYLSSFGLGDVAIRYDYDDTLPCSSPPSKSTTASFTVSAQVINTCQVSATDLDFGTVQNLNANIDQTSTITARCTPLTPYSISLNNGLTGTSPTARKMTNGGNSVTYGLYRNNTRTNAWGDILGLTHIGIGTGNNQNITVYGRVPPQATPSANTYTDTISVIVTY